MGEFTISKWQVGVATLVGTCLFLINFIVIFQDFEWTWMNTLITIAVTIVYLTMVSIVIYEPDQYLQKMTKEEIEDQVHERLDIDDDEDILSTKDSPTSQN